MADVLFGNYNPSGRLPISVPRHSGQLPVYYNYKPSKAYMIMKDGYPLGPGLRRHARDSTLSIRLWAELYPF